MMPDEAPFLNVTIQFHVPDIAAGLEFYSKLFQKRPDFEPHDDFKEWRATPGCTFQLGQGDPRPGHAMRFLVKDIETERLRVERDLGVSCTPVRRIEGLVALTTFTDPWGHRLGLYQRLYTAEPRNPGGRFRDEPSWQPYPEGAKNGARGVVPVPLLRRQKIS